MRVEAAARLRCHRTRPEYLASRPTIGRVSLVLRVGWVLAQAESESETETERRAYLFFVRSRLRLRVHVHKFGQMLEMLGHLRRQNHIDDILSEFFERIFIQSCKDRRIRKCTYVVRPVANFTILRRAGKCNVEN